jgi:hypothetical protein
MFYMGLKSFPAWFLIKETGTLKTVYSTTSNSEEAKPGHKKFLKDIRAFERSKCKYLQIFKKAFTSRVTCYL